VLNRKWGFISFPALSVPLRRACFPYPGQVHQVVSAAPWR
jgi:hypothetical protein